MVKNPDWKNDYDFKSDLKQHHSQDHNKLEKDMRLTIRLLTPCRLSKN